MTQKTELTFEIEETVVLKRGGFLSREYCPRCRKVVDMLSPDVLSLLDGVSEREIFRLIESGTVYFAEAGRLVVCPSCYRNVIHDPEAAGAIGSGRNEELGR